MDEAKKNTPEIIVNKVLRMRYFQRKYFATHDKFYLERAKKYERIVDLLIGTIDLNSQPDEKETEAQLKLYSMLEEEMK